MCPPEDNGCFGPDPADPIEADDGTGFRLTGEAPLNFV